MEKLITDTDPQRIVDWLRWAYERDAEIQLGCGGVEIRLYDRQGDDPIVCVSSGLSLDDAMAQAEIAWDRYQAGDADADPWTDRPMPLWVARRAATGEP